ncbi:hypothetical protein O181_020698 [Austropuccinia psidii MF-1]|uniref:Uncharacterized protein n=1 Tax=Austropuccinia psidii MF-1 TaxID=1389203 RepID=A0A9Q3GUR6_9BASI|nr:hypothetical protein [Austropuccinia psidii MF-1]
MTSNSSLDQITLRHALSLRIDAAKIKNESLPTTSTRQNYFPIPTPHTQHASGGSAEIISFDSDYIPTFKIPSELKIGSLSNHQITHEALENLQKILSDTIIPPSWRRVPCKISSPYHGSLKAT